MLLQIFGTILFLFGALPLQTSPTPPAQHLSRISGTVVDAISGEPVAQAVVVISSRNTSANQATTSATDGSFAFENVEPGKYVLSARHRGYLSQNYEQHENFTTAVVVGPELDSENLRFTLEPTASISGTVTDELSDPVRHAQVMLFRLNTFRGKRATRLRQRGATDDEGHFRFAHLPPGTYFVGVSAKPWYAMNGPLVRRMGFQPEQLNEVVEILGFPFDPLLDVVYPVTFFTNATDIAGAAPITLHPGDAEVADVSLRPVPALHLQLKTPVSEDGQNSYVQVMQPLLENEQESIQVNTESVAPGLMEVSGLPPGRFNLKFITSKGGDSTVRSQAIQVSGNTQVEVSDAPAGAVVSGLVQMDDGSALAQPANVQLRSFTTGEVVGSRSEPDGQFTFKDNPVPPGTYELIVFEQVGTVVRSLSATGAKVVGHSLQIADAPEVHAVVVLTKGSSQITGFALKDGEPFGGAMVLLVPQDPENNQAVFRMDQSNTDGSFTLTAVPPGTFTVVAIENGWDLEWATPVVLQKYLPGGEKVQAGLNPKLDIKVKVQ